MWAADKGQREMCVKLAQLGANLNMANRVSKTFSDCISVWRFIVVMLTLFFYELGRQDGLYFGCCEQSDGGVCETG